MVTRIQTLETDFTRTLRSGRELCEELERGQAEAPLAEHFARIQDPSTPFTVTVLGVDPASRGAALGWLCGGEPHMVAVSVPSEVGLVEVTLRERGYVLERLDGSRAEFETLDPFLAAIRDADLARPGDPSSWIDPVRVQLAAPPALRGLRLLMPENLEVVDRDPRLLSRLVEETNLAVLAAPDGYRFSDAERDILSQLGESMDALQPLALAPESPSFAARRAGGWWNDPRLGGALHVLAPGALIASGFTSLPACLSPESAEAQRLLATRLDARKLRSAVDLVCERLDDEGRRIRGRMKLIARQARTQDGTSGDDARDRLDQVHLWIDGELGNLGDQLEEENRRLMLPEGTWTRCIEELLSELSDDDLVQERGARAVRLSAAPDLVAEITRSQTTWIRERLHEDVVRIEERLRELRACLGTKLSEALGAGLPPELEGPDADGLERALVERSAVELRYRGEMPRRGFLQRLGEGRRPIFMVMMMVSLFGGALGFQRSGPLMGVFSQAMVILFLVTFAWTYVSWRRQDGERVQAEVEKLRAALARELAKRLGEAQREKLRRFTGHLAKLQKDVSRDLDARMRERARTDTRRVEAERQALQGQVRTLESALESLRGRVERAQALRATARELETESRRLWAEVASPAPVHGGRA